MQIYKSKFGRIAGTSHAEVIRSARREYHKIQKRTPRRQAYVRSSFFSKDKVFVSQFWDHLKQKHPGDQLRRARYYACAIDLIRHSVYAPDTVHKNQDLNSSLHRFYGATRDGEHFCVQIIQNKRTDRKDFISVFPSKKPK